MEFLGKIRMCGPVVYRKCVTVCGLWSFKISKTGPISLHLSPTCNTMQILSSFFSTLSACPLPCFLPWWSWTLTPVTINKFPVKCFFLITCPLSWCHLIATEQLLKQLATVHRVVIKYLRIKWREEVLFPLVVPRNIASYGEESRAAITGCW